MIGNQKIHSVRQKALGVPPKKISINPNLKPVQGSDIYSAKSTKASTTQSVINPLNLSTRKKTGISGGTANISVSGATPLNHTIV